MNQAHSLFAGAAAAEQGLICAYRLPLGKAPVELTAETLASPSGAASDVLWLHFNLGDARARRWLLQAEFVPTELRDVLHDLSTDRRIEPAGRGVLLVVSDFSYEHDSDPSETAPLWCYADAQLLITARLHPLKSSDELRLSMRQGALASSGVDLAMQLLQLRTARMKGLAAHMSAQLDDIEDQILAGNIARQREQLGRTRRLCARLRREFAPERADLNRFAQRSASALSEANQELVSECAEALGFVLEEFAEVYERAKLLQEELASRVAENTGRNLYVLSILTAVLLPMTLVTGVFGMNVAGLPGLMSESAFAWVMFLIIASGGATLALLFWRGLL